MGESLSKMGGLLGKHENSKVDRETCQTMMYYAVLRMFYVLIKAINKSNSGNLYFIEAILKNPQNWNYFYENLSPYCKLFFKELDEHTDMKLKFGTQQSNGKHEFEYVLISEFNNFHPEEMAKRDQSLQVVPKPKLSPVTEHIPEISKPLSPEQLKYISILVNNYLMIISSRIKLTKLGRSVLEIFGLLDSVLSSKKCHAIEYVKSSDEDHIQENTLVDDDFCPPDPFLSNMLDSLKQPDTVPEKTGDDVIDNQILQYQEQIREHVTEAKQKQAQIKGVFVAISLASKTEMDPVAINEDDESYDMDSTSEFHRQREKQEQEHKEKLENLREKGRQKRKEHEDEMNELRMKQKQYFTTFINCIIMKERFEDKENEWSDFIENSYKKLVVGSITRFQYFLEVTRNPAHFKKLREESPNDLNMDIFNLDSDVIALFEDLKNLFTGLNNVVLAHPDALFLRVLQKSVYDIAMKLISVSNVLEQIDYSSEWYQRLEQAINEIRATDIPTVQKLRRTCKRVKIEEFVGLEFPKNLKTNVMVIEEVDEKDEKTEEEEATIHFEEVQNSTDDYSEILENGSVLERHEGTDQPSSSSSPIFESFEIQNQTDELDEESNNENEIQPFKNSEKINGHVLTADNCESENNKGTLSLSEPGHDNAKWRINDIGWNSNKGQG